MDEPTNAPDCAKVHLYFTSGKHEHLILDQPTIEELLSRFQTRQGVYVLQHTDGTRSFFALDAIEVIDVGQTREN